MRTFILRCIGMIDELKTVSGSRHDARNLS